MEELNATIVDRNRTELNEVFNHSLNKHQLEVTTVSHWIVQFYFVFVFFGGLVNLIYTTALLRCKRNGILTLILQLAFVDSILFYVTYIEVLTIQKHSWQYSAENCQFFNGFEILTNSLVTYLLLCINFHIISLCTLHSFEIRREPKNPLTSCHDDSDECLVTKNESSNRTLNIDYRKRKNDVSVIFPSIFIWFICISLSIPSFTLTSTLNTNRNTTLCCIVDSFYGQVMQLLLILFKIAVPLPLLILSFITLIVKLCKTSKNVSNNVLTRNFEELRILLIFCILMTICYIVTSFQRHFFYIFHFYHSSNNSGVQNFEVPPLFNNHVHPKISIYSSMLHYTSISVRGCLYFYLLPKFRSILRTNIVCCFRADK